MSKETIQKIVTPKVELAWVCITGEGKENMSGKLQYKVDGIIDPSNETHKAFIESIDAYWEANKPKGFKRKPKSMGYRFCDKQLDEDGNPIKNDEDKFVYDPKGRIALNFATATVFPDGSVKKVKTRNSKNAVVELGETLIGNGSEGYIAGAMDIYGPTKSGDAGVTLYLDEIKLTKLVEFGGADPFADTEEEEDGWTGEDADPFVGTESDAKPRL